MFHPVDVPCCMHTVVHAETVCMDWNDFCNMYVIFAICMSLLSSVGSRVYRLACGISVLSSSHVLWFCVPLHLVAGASVFVAEDSTSMRIWVFMIMLNLRCLPGSIAFPSPDFSFGVRSPMKNSVTQCLPSLGRGVTCSSIVCSFLSASSLALPFCF